MHPLSTTNLISNSDRQTVPRNGHLQISDPVVWLLTPLDARTPEFSPPAEQYPTQTVFCGEFIVWSSNTLLLSDCKDNLFEIVIFGMQSINQYPRRFVS